MTTSRRSTTKRVTAADAKARLSELMARVAYAGDTYVIERRGKPLAALVAIDDLKQIERASLDTGGIGDPGERHGALALTGAWEEVPDDEIDAIFKSVIESRAEQGSRSAPDLG